MNNYINMRREGLPTGSKIYYNNKLSREEPSDDEDFDIKQERVVSNSILEDQFSALKKRNHYLRVSTINIDSRNRNRTNIVNSQLIYYNKLGFLISRINPQKLFVYQPDNKFTQDTFIYWENINERIKTINGVSASVIEYDPIRKKPIFNIYTQTNREMLSSFSWSFLKPIVDGQYDNEAAFIADSNTKNFYFFYYTDNNSITAGDWLYIEPTKEIKIYQVLDTLVGYPTSSYYKIIPSRILTNIYKIKMLDLKIPNIIFNVNNKNYNIGNYKYLVNGTLRLLIERNSYTVSNIDYIGDRIKYDFFYKQGVYDVNNYNLGAFAFLTNRSIQQKIYPDIFIGTNIYDLMNSILPILTDNNMWLNYLNNNIFELAYYFLTKYNQYYKTINLETFALNHAGNPDNVFYIYTVDLIKQYFSNQNVPIILKPADNLNNKMPEIYLNDYILYVNNETFKIVLKTVNWMDIMYRSKGNQETINNDFIDCFTNIDGTEVLVGRVVNYNADYFNNPNNGLVIGDTTYRNINYTLGIYPYLANFSPANYYSFQIFALSNWSSATFIPNMLTSYIEVDTLQNIYYYSSTYTANTSQNFINRFLRFEYLAFKAISSNEVLSNSVMTFTNPLTYIFGLSPTVAGFYPMTYVSKVIYSRPNLTIQQYNKNTIVTYLNVIGGVYYYIAYTYGALSFSKDDLIYELIGTNYTQIGKVQAYFDVFSYLNLSGAISGFTPGMKIHNVNLSKANTLIRYQFSNTYIAAYNSNGLTNYYSQMFYTGETIYNNTGTSLGLTVSANYEYLGQISDVRFTLALDASIYLSEQVNYDVTATKALIVPPIPVVIPLDNIRIIETRTQTKYNIIEYRGKTLLLDNKAGTKYSTQIINQPFLDKELNLFIFNLSIKDPSAIIPNIYIYQNFEGFIDNTIVGTAYSIDYTPVKYAIVVEKSDNFQMLYLQNWAKNIYNKSRISPYNFSVLPNRNYVCANPDRTNMTGLLTYDLYPRYEIQLDDGYYNDETFAAELENKLNSIQYLEYNYAKKQIEYIDATNQQVDDANFERTRFKTVFNPTTREINIKCYRVLNRIFYTALYNPITPYLYFKIENADVENNIRMYIEVLRDAANNNYTNTIKNQLNREFTTRVLPIFNYELRVISPVPSVDFIELIPANIRKDLDSARALLSKIGLEPYSYRTDFPNLTRNRRNAGQMLKNVYNNSWSYVSAGKTIYNPGVPIPFLDDELVMIVNNIYFNYEQYKLGRVVSINDKVSNSRGNYNVYIQMVGDTKVSHPFWVGDIIYGLESGAIAMIVPYEWGMLTDDHIEIARLHSGLPSEDVLKMGYKNYLKFLFKYSGKNYLLDYIQKYNLQAYNQFNFREQGSFLDKFLFTNFNPFLNWPIQEVKNCFRGFEIYFDYPVAFKIFQNELVLNFLKENRYCLFLGKNNLGVNDTPKDILGFEDDQILNIGDYANNTKPIPWNSVFNNSYKINSTSIIHLYLSYGSDNILQNKFYLKVNSIKDFAIGDKVNLKDVIIRPTIQRNAFNIYNTTNHNLTMIITFEMYLSYILFRLVLIKLGISVPLGPNDYMRLTSNNISQMTQIVNSMYYDPSTTNVLAYTNFIIENYNSIINSNNINYADPDLTNGLYMAGNTPLVNRISLEVANIINIVILDKILKWFVQPANVLLWTKGDRQTYVLINQTYIDFTNVIIYRFELEILDNFVFQPNLLVRDNLGNIIGRVTYNNLYRDYLPDNNTFYTLYVRLQPGYTMSLSAGIYIFSDDLMVKNRLKSNPVLISSNNNYVYLYDTYLKNRSVFQATGNNNNTVQEALNFNNIDSINNVFYNLFNLNNQSIDSFKNGYYVSIARNEVYFNQAENIKGTYRVMLNLLDNKNILRICEQLGLIGDINIINQTIVQNTNNIVLIKSLMDVCQLIIDLSPINTFLVDLVWNQEIETEIFAGYRYQVRRVDNTFSIVGSRNVYFERYRYRNIFIYGDPFTNPNALIIPYLNSIFTSIYSNEIMNTARATNTVESQMCNWSQIISKYPNINVDINILDENENTQFCYGILWVDMAAGEDTAYVVFLLANDFATNKTGFTVNRNNLQNYLINFNFIYIDQQKSIDVQNLENTQMNQSNIIKSIDFVQQSIDANNYITTYKYDPSAPAGSQVSYSPIPQYRIFKIKLKYPIKYDIIRGTPILIKDYYTTMYKAPNVKVKGANKLYIQQNWTGQNQFNLQKGSVININYGSYNSIYLKYINSNDNISNQLYSFDNNDIIHEETNVVVDYSNTSITVDGKTYLEITLENPIKYEFKTGLPVVFSYFPMNMQPQSIITPDYIPWQNILYNNNNIICHCLCTQNIIVNGEWYTKIFYQSEKNLDIYDVNSGGIQGISPKSKRTIYISGMKGIVTTNIGFQQIERNYLNSNLVSLEDYQLNHYIKPVPDGTYQVEYIQKEDGITILSSNNYDISIPGSFDSIYNTNTPEQDDEYIDNNQNYRWFYVIEDNGLDISNLSGQDLYQFTPSNVDVNTGALPGPPSNTDTRMDVLIKIKYIETTSYVNTLPYLGGKTIYRIYGKMIISNLSSRFLMNPYPPDVIYSDDTNNPHFPINCYLTDINKQYKIGIIYYLYNDSSDFTFNNSLSKYKYYNVIIKGRYRGFGGSISLSTTNNIINSIDYTISNIFPSSNIIELDIENNQNIYCSFYRFNSYGEYRSVYDVYKQNYNKSSMLSTQLNPIFTGFQQIPYQFNPTRDFNPNEIINYYDIYPSRYGFIAESGELYKTEINKPYSTDILDYIYVCFKNIDSNMIVDQNDPVGDKIIFAKVYINKQLNNYDVDYTNYEVIYDTRLLPNLKDIEVFFLDKQGYLVNFNNLDNNLVLEIQEYVERVKNLNTRNGMVY